MKRRIGIALYWFFGGLAVLLTLGIIADFTPIAIYGGTVTCDMWFSPIAVLWVLWFARLSHRYLVGDEGGN